MEYSSLCCLSFYSFILLQSYRWVPLYFEDCMALKRRFSDLWENFCNDGFVVQQALHKGSGSPMEQALDKQYNKQVKRASGVMKFTNQEQAVWKWTKIYLRGRACKNICTRNRRSIFSPS